MSSPTYLLFSFLLDMILTKLSKFPASIAKSNNYELVVDLPGFTKDEVKATLEDGILTLFIPKKEAKTAVEQKKTIAIEG